MSTQKSTQNVEYFFEYFFENFFEDFFETFTMIKPTSVSDDGGRGRGALLSMVVALRISRDGLSAQSPVVFTSKTD